jgi:exocyst complex protein 7
MAGPDGEARVLLTAQHIVKALGTTDTMTDDMIQILSNFDHRFSSMNEKKIELKLDDKEAEIEDDYHQHSRNSRASNARNPSHARANNSTLDRAENVVVQWDAGYSEQARQKWLFENGEESLTYLNAVDDVLNQLESMKSHNKDPGTLERAQNLLQLAMTRLVEELRHLLETCGKSVDPDWLLDSWAAGYFRTPLPNVVDPESEGSEDDEDDDEDDVPVAQPVGAVQTMVDLVPPDVAQDMSDIVSRLILGGMKREASQAYVSSRKNMLEESLYELGVEKLTIDEVQKMQWEVQEDKIKNWNQAIKVGVKVLFASEKQLCDKVNVSFPFLFFSRVVGIVVVYLLKLGPRKSVLETMQKCKMQSRWGLL